MTTAREDEALLALSQWLSPAFPIGSFAYSHGLEWAIASGEVTDAGTLRSWIAAVLRWGAGRSDAILLACAGREGADLDELDAFARALAASEERLRETAEQGVAFVAAVNAVGGAALPALVLPVAVGAAARGLRLAPARVAALWLQGLAGALVSVGVRFVPLGQTEGQRVLAALRPVVLEVAGEAARADVEAIGTAALGAELAAMRHETMVTRIYRT